MKALAFDSHFATSSDRFPFVQVALSRAFHSFKRLSEEKTGAKREREENTCASRSLPVLAQGLERKRFLLSWQRDK
jgi:hypothetical protein